MGVAPARAVAYEVLRRVFEQGAFADRALHGSAAALDPRDRALAMTLVFGTVQRRRTLDHVLGQLSSRPLQRLEPAALAALRLGSYQLLLLDGISDYAAVDDSVELAKLHSRGGAPTVNAVLRRVTREGRSLLAGLDDSTPASAALLHSVPDWLAELWWEELGSEEAVALLRTVNQPAESAIRVNTLRAEPAAVIEALPVSSASTPELPEGLVLEGGFDVFSSELWKAGKIMPQSRASMLVARTLAPAPGDRVLDLCAAPGGKTTHLAALMEGRGELVAVEVQARRAQALARTCEQMGATNVRVRREDGREIDAGQFDRVLVDPPCSGLGTLQTRPDLRWQPRRGELTKLAAQQAQLLRAAAGALAPGGTLVYSVCTISRIESDAVVDDLLARDERFVCEQRRQLLPSRDGTDGFFIARLSRR
jgi:16S rRNA (cytosine967-C5)-methyltransferase